MIPNDIDMLFMLIFLGLDAVTKDFCFSLQVIENLHIYVGIKFHSNVVHHRISNIVDLVEDDFYALVRELSAFKNLSRLVTDLKSGDSVHQLL